MFGNFRVINFHVVKFLWSGANTKIYQHENLFTYIEKWSITKRISVFAALTCIATSGRRLLCISLCQCDLWGCSDYMCLVSPSPLGLPGCPSQLPPALLDSPERYWRWKWAFGSSKLSLRCRYCCFVLLSCLHDRIVYIYVHYTTRYYSLLKIFRVINFRRLSQPRKYFNNETFPNYSRMHIHWLITGALREYSSRQLYDRVPYRVTAHCSV